MGFEFPVGRQVLFPFSLPCIHLPVHCRLLSLVLSCPLLLQSLYDMFFQKELLILFWTVATHSSILARRIPAQSEPGGLQSVGRKELDMIEWLSTAQHIAT